MANHTGLIELDFINDLPEMVLAVLAGIGTARLFFWDWVLANEGQGWPFLVVLCISGGFWVVGHEV